MASPEFLRYTASDGEKTKQNKNPLSLFRQLCLRLKTPHHVVTAASRIQGRTKKQFCNCAPQRPHIYSFTEGKPQQDLWCPARGQITGLPLLSKLRCSSGRSDAKTCLDFLTCRSEFGHTNPQPLLIFHRPNQSQSAWLWRALVGGSPAWCFQASGLRVRPGWPSSGQVQWPTSKNATGWGQLVVINDILLTTSRYGGAPAALLVWFLSAVEAESFFPLKDDEGFYPAAQILDINVLCPQKHCTTEQYCTCPGPVFLFYAGWISMDTDVELTFTKYNDFPLFQSGITGLTSRTFQ